MIEEDFNEVYMKFKLKFYQAMFEKIQTREMTLSAVESFCIEIIYAMNNPTVTEFANFIKISSPNAAYKINSLIKKGYLRKIQSQDDKREYHLEVTDKYLNYYNLSTDYVKTVTSRLEGRFNDEELTILQRILRIMSKDLMPELEAIDSVKFE